MNQSLTAFSTAEAEVTCDAPTAVYFEAKDLILKGEEDTFPGRILCIDRI